MSTVVTKAAGKVGLNSKRTSKLADVMLFLTILAMTPYDKEMMQIIPPDWTPYVIKVGMFAQVALRFLKSHLVKQEMAAEEDAEEEDTATPPPPAARQNVT